MFQILDTVVHPFSGVCQIRDIRKEKFGDHPELYYVLVPLKEKGSNLIYVPVDSEKIRLRKPLTKREIQSILRSVASAEVEWQHNDKNRAEQFSLLLREGSHAQIIKMIALLHQWKEERQKSGKKMPASDERLLQEAQSMIHREFAYALDLDEPATVQYIMKRIAG